MTCSRTEPFVDWLDVTCNAHGSETFVRRLDRFLGHQCYPLIADVAGKRSYRVGSGVLMVTLRSSFHRASASGSCIRHMQEQGVFRDYVNVLGSVPHNVTRLDVAVDLATDAPPVLRALEDRYSDDRYSFGRTSLKVTRLYSRRASDGALTGTWYVGHRTRAGVSARVYDKQQEALDNRCEVLPPTTRYELTFRKTHGCSLFDVLNPFDLFYHHASPGLLDAPREFTPWESRGTVPWVSPARYESMPMELFERQLDRCPDLERLAAIAVQLGPTGKAVVMRRFEAHLDRLLRASESGASSEAGVALGSSSGTV